MPTVAEILKASGLTDEQIAGLDAKVVTGFTTVLSSADEARAKAELAQRAQQQQYDQEIAPALNTWATEKANLEAQAAFYRTQNEQARQGGFLPQDAPGYRAPDPNPPRNDNGTYRAGANPVPGSPGLEEKVSTAMGNIADLQWKYRTLYGAEMPDSPTALAAEASAQKLPLLDYAARKYDFSKKEADIAAERQKKHDESIRKEERDKITKEFAEKGGNNPFVRQGQDSQYGSVRQAVAEGKRKDPLTMTPQERSQNTRAGWQHEIAERETASA